jgi:tetratricopeptide (TPR) repeat protein
VIEAFRQRELDRLVILMRNAAAGAWAIALYNTVAVRDQVMNALRERLAPLPVYDFTFTERCANPLAYLERLSPKVEAERAVIFLYDLTRGGTRVWGYLEMQREALADQPHGLVFWMTPAERSEAVHRAPNFWSQRSGVFDFTIPDAGALMLTRSQAAARPAQFVDRADWERQVRLYQGLLEEYEEQNDAPADTMFDLYDKLVDLHYEMANYRKVAELVQEQLVLARESGDQEQMAQGLGNLGDVQYALGDLAGARASFERALAIFGRFLPPDHPNIEIVRGNLARISDTR